jgi:murein DD-endopeptidase MepM/ murein hydrolase activator NlpD
MALEWRDRLQTIAVTVVLTSVAWLAIGLFLFARQVDASPREAQPNAAAAGPPGTLIVPVQGVRREALSDTWGQSRADGARAHEAIDIMARRGTPVLAAAAGTVEKLFVSERGGTTVYVRSPDRRTIYYYAHLDGYAPGLAERQQVRGGHVLGYVGSTGDASPDGPHLHFGMSTARPEESWWQGQPINPYPLLRR